MAKAVFRPGELTVLSEKVIIDAPTSFPDLAHLAPVEEELEVHEAVEEYSGPTADDLRREAEEFKIRWEAEREAMIQAAKDRAGAIVQEAEAQAAGLQRQNAEEAEAQKIQAGKEAEELIAQARQKALEIEEETRKTLEDERKEVLEQGREAGRTEGFTEGRAEVERLIQRTQTVLERAQDKRSDILAETEQEIIDLVLLLSRKVIKVISDNQRGVVISNVIQALRKVKGRGNIVIRVNLVDVKLATEHTKDFIQMLEGVKSIQVVEDSSVDSGGCIIETDFGEIDARIASQLAELEAKILEISPIKSKIKSAAVNGPNGGPAASAEKARAAVRASQAALEAASESAAGPAAAPAEGT
ncbi:MAG: flagellar assembly protein FliH [Treponema sp.]|jgi:flagellar assembly protein FliH|nr:flagellar assembly protein FliH [Treponema sp.]